MSIWIYLDLSEFIWIHLDLSGFICVYLDFSGFIWVYLVFHRMVKNTQSYMWVDGIGYGMGLGLGWDGSPGGRRYRAPYGANKCNTRA